MLIIKYNLILILFLFSFITFLLLSIFIHQDLFDEFEKISKHEFLELKKSLNLSFKLKNTKCSMSKCFNVTKCNENELKIYVYDEPVVVKSEIYKNILKIFKSSIYLTQNPDDACLFIISIDTLDRDKLSLNYVRDLKDLILNLKYWNNGENHLIFNLYSGSWPNYIDNLEFNTNKAILVKASFSAKTYRKNFDISFPLFHSELPFNDSFVIKQNLSYTINKKKYFLTFKGKRYLHGIGSETRNSLYHLNNNRDIILLTTCKHGLNWEYLKDDRCDEDNLLYEKYDYNDLIYNSIFCLIPRGRRLGTYRFLEALKAGCIPVILSNSLVLPFSEILDWNKAVLWADEKHLTSLTSNLREISNEQINFMKKNCIFYYQEYFSSIDRIINTTLSIILKRIFKLKIKLSRNLSHV